MRLPRHVLSLAIVLTVAVLLLGFIAVAAKAATPNPDCQLRVPANPMSAAGLATPYQLSAQDPAAGVCDEANTDQTAFVEAAVLDPASGALSVYHPLVVNAGDMPAVAPVVPTLPPHAVVGIWFGSNGNTLKLAGPGARHAVNGLGHGDLFGQFSYLNAPALFAAANQAIAAGKLTVPPLGVDAHGTPCPTVRDFSVVDQDQSDNLATAYALVGGKMAQWKASYTGVQTKMTNGSDEGTLANRIDPAIGCTPFKLPSLDDPGVMVTSLVANELSAAKNQGDPVARVPLNDPMTLLANGKESVEKTNLYRAGVDQRPLNFFTAMVDTPKRYCTNLMAISPVRRAADQALLAAKPSPTAGQTLDVFLEARYQASLTALGCPNPTTVLAHRHGSDHDRDAHHGPHWRNRAY